MITLTFAGDESGDASFSFGKGASRYFVVAVVATEDPDSLRNQLANVRHISGLPAAYEFKFHDLSSTNLRKRTFSTLAEAQFDSWAIIVDKTILPDSYKLMSSLDFYLYFVTELIRSIPVAKREGATLILDEFGSVNQLRTEMRRVLKIRGISSRFKRVLIKRSRSESLIQIADLVAGSIYHRDSKSGSETFELIQNKLCKILEFQP
jgi:hypothetical protein